MDRWLITVIGVTALAVLIEMWRLVRRFRLDVIGQLLVVLSKAFQTLDNANDAAEKFEDAAGDVATVTEDLKSRERQGLWGLLK